MIRFKIPRIIQLVICMGLILLLCCSCAVNNNEISSNNYTGSESAGDVVKSDNTENNMRNELIGIWHASPSLGAGWNNVFVLNEDNSFKLYYSQFDEEKRTIDMSGKWNISEGRLILNVSQKTIVEGGELADASPSATSKYQIVNGTVKVEKLEPAVIMEYSLGQLVEADDSPYEHKMLIDGEYYYKISDEPSSIDFSNQYSSNNSDKASSTEKTPAEFDKNIIGVWHLPIGTSTLYGDRYIFCEDGTYLYFEPEQFDNPKNEYGTWKTAGGTLILKPTNSVTEAGRINTMTEFYFEVKKGSALNTKEEKRLTVSEITYDKSFEQHVMNIDGDDYYRIYDKNDSIKWIK